MRGYRSCAFWARGFAALCAALMIAAGLSPRPAEAARRHSSFIESVPIPDILKVPPGNVLLLQASARGTQKYACPLTTPPKAVPHAILLAGEEGERDLVAIHFGGPTWEALDGSSVVGDGPNAKHFISPDPDSIDWLLIPAKSTTGNGQFSTVTYIQRLFTNGGKPPVAGCATAQTEVLVEYTAWYFFYVHAAARP